MSRQILGGLCVWSSLRLCCTLRGIGAGPGSTGSHAIINHNTCIQRPHARVVRFPMSPYHLPPFCRPSRYFKYIGLFWIFSIRQYNDISNPATKNGSKQVPRVYTLGYSYGEECPSPIGEGNWVRELFPSPRIFLIFGRKIRILGMQTSQPNRCDCDIQVSSETAFVNKLVA